MPGRAASDAGPPVQVVVERPPAGPARGVIPVPAGAVVALGLALAAGALVAFARRGVP